MNDPTYKQAEIRANPEWDLAFVLSEIQNDAAPIGWSRYVLAAKCLLGAFDVRRKGVSAWIDTRAQKPPMQRFVSGQGLQPPKPPYVLAVDVKGRMSVGYARENSEGYTWVFAKPIGEPTHFQPLPEPPKAEEFVDG